MSANSGRTQRQGNGVVSLIRQHAHVRVVLPAMVATGLTAYVISIAVAPKSAGQLWQIVKSTWWLILLLTPPYLAIRAMVWRSLLKELNIEIPWRPLIASFAAGEMTKALPAGVYVENYLLAKVAHFRGYAVARSSMATTATLGLESIVAVPILLAIGIPGSPWIRWAVLAIIAAWMVVLLAVWMFVRYRAHVVTDKSPQWQQQGIQFARAFLQAGADLISWQTVALVIPTALYMLIYVIDLYAILRALGIRRLDFVDVMSLYSFVVLVVILIPIPTELGLTDFSGLSGLVAFGVASAPAAIVMLALRALVTGATIAFAGTLLFLLRSELVNADTDGDSNASNRNKERIEHIRAGPDPEAIAGR